MIEAEQTEDGKTERNDRLLGAAIHSYARQDLDSIKDVSKRRTQRLGGTRSY